MCSIHGLFHFIEMTYEVKYDWIISSMCKEKVHNLFQAYLDGLWAVASKTFPGKVVPGHDSRLVVEKISA